MNAQEAFNQVWQHFVVERAPLSFAFGKCLYRGPNGARCAIGLLIPDDQYRPIFEINLPVSKMMYRHLVPALEGLDTAFALELQNCHDYAALDDDSKISVSLASLAARWGLTLPEVTHE